MSGVATIAPSCTGNTTCFDMKNDIECSSSPSSSNGDSTLQLINMSTDETKFLDSECILGPSPPNFKENVEESPVSVASIEPNIVIKIEPVDNPEESHSCIQSSESNSNTHPLQPSLGGFTSNVEERCLNHLDQNKNAVLQPILYDNAQNCSYNQKELIQTNLYYSQPFLTAQHPFQPQGNSLQQFTVYNQMLPNVPQGLHPNGNQKYSNAFQLILNGFQPHTNNYHSFTNEKPAYPRISDLHPSVDEFNTERIQPSINEKPLPTGVGQSYPIYNPSLPNDIHQHPLVSLAQLTASQSSSSPNESQSCKNPPIAIQPNTAEPSLNGNQLLSNNNLSQSALPSMSFRDLPFSGDSPMQLKGNKHSLYFNQLPPDPLETDKTTFVDVIAPLEKYFRGDTCLLCGFKSSAKRACGARRHLITHLDRRDFKCTVCGKGFVTPEYQLEHEKTHSAADTFQCAACDSKFRSRKRLTLHEKKYHQGIRFQCPLCDMQLATRVTFKSHLTLHTGELPYQCSTCFERFRTKNILRLHESKHTGAKRFTCEICGKGINGRSQYKQHLDGHEKKGAFACDKCDKTFNYRSNRAQHRKTHSEDRLHECSECGKKFKFPHHLRNHVATHGPVVKTE